MNCPTCGQAVMLGQAFCGNCGTPLQTAKPEQQPADPITPQSPYAQPDYATPVASNRTSAWLLLLMLALVAGLGVAAFMFLSSRQRGATQTQAQITKPDVTVQEPAPVSPSDTPSSVSPATADVPVTQPVPAVRTQANPKKTSGDLARSSSASARPDSAPSLVGPSPVPRDADPQPATSAPAPASSDGSRRRAVQESDTEAPPMPEPSPSLVTAPQSTHVPEPAPANPDTAAPPPGSMPQAEPPLTRTYTGPLSGVATWTGKLEKNGTLTITAGTPSTGVLSGAGLPGVPVRISINQSNFGFAEMPSAANGYRRLVLKSHAKHNRITIHWTVIQ